MESHADVAILTIIQPELDALRRTFHTETWQRVKAWDGTIYLRGQVESKRHGRKYKVAIGTMGLGGNSSSASATQAIIERCRPKAVFLLGIAAGIRKKVQIG